MLEEVIFNENNGVGVITLNRPDRLNALTYPMVQKLNQYLNLWEVKEEINCVIIEGAGDRSFCAGGDVVKLRKEVLADGGPPTQLSKSFFYDEYTLNYKISNFKKPFIALINGFTMGGGVGISMHGSHVVASEKTMFAMPETAIGLFPDVGGGWLLGQLDKGIGAWLSLVGAKLKAYDLISLNLATNYVASTEIEKLKNLLITSSPDTNDKVTSVINSLSSIPKTEDSVLLAHEEIIKDAFSFDKIEDIFERCETLSKLNNKFFNTQFEELKHKSPTSLKISLKQIREASQMSLKDELIMEYRMVQKCLKIGDFFEGVRAMLVDKDRKPNWSPSSINDVDESRVDEFFKSLNDLDLVLEN
ncbi:MAG: enoyl-CoA hydratase/isomerase family protein [Alphaproteobacteria bacterium]|nr:enoyl-CoA hydratase/isomerase family protein [Alphaproteobacteria bacterium]